MLAHVSFSRARHHAHVSWTIIISLVTDASGLRVKVDNQFEPHYESKTEGFIIAEESHRIRDPIHILKPIFPVGLTLEHELASLKKFESVSTVFEIRVPFNSCILSL
jgi:hypothetical protein